MLDLSSLDLLIEHPDPYVPPATADIPALVPRIDDAPGGVGLQA